MESKQQISLTILIPLNSIWSIPHSIVYLLFSYLLLFTMSRYSECLLGIPSPSSLYSKQDYHEMNISKIKKLNDQLICGFKFCSKLQFQFQIDQFHLKNKHFQFRNGIDPMSYSRYFQLLPHGGSLKGQSTLRIKKQCNAQNSNQKFHNNNHEIYLISEIQGNNPNFWRASIMAAAEAKFKGGKEQTEMP